jgi:predicted RNA-binding Zn-ribbon protein involved in translation (DUF1610 family)
MVVCPSCGKEIDHLINWSKQWRKYVVRLGEGGDLEFEEVEEAMDVLRDEFICPECEEVIAVSEEHARGFLAGRAEGGVSVGKLTWGPNA